MKARNHTNRIGITLAAGLMLVAGGAMADEARPAGANVAEVTPTSIQTQTLEAMASLRAELHLSAEDVDPIRPQAPARQSIAEESEDGEARTTASAGEKQTGGLVIYIGNR